MSIESIKARMEEHDRQRERFGYCDETAPQIWERELRALLKVAVAAKEYRDAEQVQMLNDFKYDEPKYERQRKAKAALDAAIAAYRQSERPGVKP